MTKIEELQKLIKEHPDLEVIPVVDSEFTEYESGYSYIGAIGTSYILRCIFYDNKFFDDIDELVEYLYDQYASEYPKEMDDTEVENKIREKALNLEGWKDAIIVHIEQADF